jgi:hypothetical protein
MALALCEVYIGHRGKGGAPQDPLQCVKLRLAWSQSAQPLRPTLAAARE